jgi:uncharacterized protein YhdP
LLRRTTKVLLEILALVCAGLAILVVMAAIKLSTGPLSVGFIAPYIVDALEPEDGSFEVSLGDAVLTWGGWERTLQLRAIGVKITGPAGDVRADIPEMTIGFSGRALLDAQLAPTSLEIVGSRLNLIRGEDGTIHFTDPAAVEPGAEPEPAPAEQAASEGGEERPQVSGDFAAELFADILAPPGPSNKMGYLTRLSILDADVSLTDRKLDMVWRAPSSTVLLLKDDAGLRLKGTFGVEIGGKTAEFALDGRYDTDNEVVSAELQLADIQPALFAASAPLFAPLAGIKLPLSGVLRVRAGFDGTVQLFALDVTGGAGTVLWPGEASDAAVPVQSLRLRAGLTDDLKALQLDELRIDLGGPVIAATGSVQGVAQGIVGGPFEVAAELAVRDLTVADLKRLWPETVATNAQRWVVANIAEGRVPDGKVTLTGAAGEAGIDSFEILDLSGGFRFTDMTVSYFDTLPAVHDGQGEATVTKDGLSFAVTSGQVQGLKVGSAKIDITGLNDPDQWLTVEVVVRGAVKNVLTILDHPRLNYVKGMGVKPADVGGETAVRLKVHLPLIEALTFKQVEIAAAAALRDVSLPDAALGLDLSDGDLTLQLDGRGMDVQGTAVLGITPITLAWSENFAPGGYARRFDVKATVDDAGRRSMGLDFDEYIQGPVGIDAVLTQYPNKKKNTLQLDADVTDAVLDIGELGWRKEAGTAGTLEASLALSGETPTAIRDFALTGDGFSMKGKASFAPDGKTVTAAEFSQLRYGRSDVEANITRHDDGGFDISVQGPALDATHFLKTEKPSADRGQSQPAGAGQPTGTADLVPLSLALTLGKLYLSDEGALANVSVRMQRGTKHWRSITVDGQPAPDKHFSVNLAPDGANRRLDVRSDDAGSVIKILDISDNIVGGTLHLSGTYDDGKPEEPLAGKIAVTDFRLVKAPVIAKLLSVALLTGILDSLRGEGIGFNRMDAAFTLRNDVIETKDAKAHGSALGITARGWINLASQTIGLRGTIVPAYAVNSLLNNIPVIGTLLGGEGSGIFAATYRMSGDLDDPDVSVNPLATLAPGFLRGLFGIFEGAVPPQETDPSNEREAPPEQPGPKD